MLQSRKLSQTRLKELLSYNKRSGVFVWIKSNSNRRLPKSIAGNKSPNGYIKIKIDGKTYLAHRLVWIYIYGEIAEYMQIDHINGIKDDNKIKNLRCVTSAENQQNIKKANSNNTSGFLGVTKNKHGSTFQSEIRVFGKRIYLGNFSTADEAYLAYIDAKRKYHKTCTI